MNPQNEIIKTVTVFIILIMLVVFILTGCTSVPVVRNFPDEPGKTVMEGCPNLKKLEDDAKLSEVAKTVSINYSTYYECAVKVDTWVEWYKIQKQIFESIK